MGEREAPEVKLQARRERHGLEFGEVVEDDAPSPLDVVGSRVITATNGTNHPKSLGARPRTVANHPPQFEAPAVLWPEREQPLAQAIHVIEQERGLGGRSDHSFTAPAVRPLTKNRIEMKNAMSSGSAASAYPASIMP